MKTRHRLWQLTVFFIMAVFIAISNVAGGTVSQVAAPVLNVGQWQFFSQNCLVTASCATAGATIRYTTGNATPTTSSPVFPSTGLTITEDTTLCVRAFKNGMNASDFTICWLAKVHETTAADYEYTINDNKVTITEYVGDKESIIIPATIEDKPVVSIGDYAFRNNGIKYISIPSGVISIGFRAFSGCENLVSIVIPSSVTSIGKYAFEECENLTSIEIPFGLITIEEEMFYGCSNLSSVIIPSSVTSIGKSAFYGCSSLASIVIPSSVTSIGETAFGVCESLESIEIPSNVAIIGEEAFAACSSLTSINVADDNANYASVDGVLFSKSKDRLVLYPPAKEGSHYSIPSSVTSMDDYAFYRCVNLTSVVIPSGVTSIGEGVFSGCSNLESVTIPSTVTSIEMEAFYGCNSLASVTIPSSVKYIGTNAFAGSGLTSVIIPSSVTSFGMWVFSGCSNLESVTLPSNMTSIGNLMFSGCSSLASITIPSSVTTIESLAFYGSGLISLTIPSSVTSIGSSAFCDCKKLKTVSIPSNVTSIGDHAFSGSGLTSVTIPPSITSIGDSAFSGCSSLESVTISSSVKSIGVYAFASSGLTSVIIPPSVVSIGEDAFLRCNSLKNVTISPGVTSIGKSAFEQCENLENVTIPDSVTSIGTWGFAGCPQLKNITIPLNVTSIEKGTFYDCKSLTSITIPYNVTSIGESAFASSGLTSVTIPSSVILIEAGAFKWCSHLTEISFDGAPPELGNAVLPTPLTCSVWPGMRWENAAMPDGVTVSIREGTNPPVISREDGLDTADFTGSLRIVMSSAANDRVLRYTVDGSMPTTGSPQYTLPFMITRACTVAARYFKNGEPCSGVAVKAFTRQYAFDEAFADSGLTFGNAVNSPWKALEDSTYGGGVVVQSGEIGDSQSTSFQTTVWGRGTVRFNWKVSSQAKQDNLKFFVDGVEAVAAISGTVYWTSVEVAIMGFGEHVLKWTYSKNYSQVSGSDCGWIADIVWISEQQEKMLEFITIVGPATIAAASTATYTCMATWSDGTTSEVTPVWNQSSTTYANVVPQGIMTNENATLTDKSVTLSADYMVNGVMKSDSKNITLKAESGSIASQALFLEAGWNWIGFHVLPTSRKIGDVLGKTVFSINDVLQTNGSQIRFTGMSWIPGSATVDFGKLYQIYVANTTTVEISGDACDTFSIPLEAGWNWIGNPTVEAVSPADLTHSSGWTAGDRIQMTSGTLTYTGSKWIPANSMLETGKGCQIYTANKGTLSFPSSVCGDDNALYAVVDLSEGPDAAHYPVRYTDSAPDLSNDTCRTTELWLRRIPAGTFIMGSPADELGRYAERETQHQATLTQDFYIGVFECTQKQWELVMGSNPSNYKGDCRPVDYVSYDMVRGTGMQNGTSWPRYGYAVATDSFMGKMRAKTGLTFDLPTEAQWEYACRAGTTTALNSGRDLTNTNEDIGINEVGRYGYNQNDGKGGYSEHTTVGSYLPNAWGLYDMHGNVREWCLDWYDKDYGKTPVSDPIGSDNGLYRVLRGGCWNYFSAETCRSASRGWSSSSFINLYGSVGFRIALRPKQYPDLYSVVVDHGTSVSSMTLEGTTVEITAAEPRDGMIFDRWVSKDVALTDATATTTTFTMPAKTVCVTATYVVDPNVIPDDTRYVVINLSDGPSATSYLVRYSSIGPDLFDDTCRMTELWLRKIPKGTFIMGSPEDELGRYAERETQHQVTLTQDFYIGVFECTQKQWELVMGNNPSSYTGDCRPVDNISYNMIRGTSTTAGAGWPTYAHAVDATSFMGKLQTKTGLTFDLPTEAQWEYACRAGTTTALNSGKNLISMYSDTNMSEVGRYGYNKSDGKGGYSEHTRVGSYLPNAWRLYDMHGNEREWCLDWGYYDIDYESGAITDPVGQATGEYRVQRGGNWNLNAFACCAARRVFHVPNDICGGSAGFRIAYLP